MSNRALEAMERYDKYLEKAITEEMRSTIKERASQFAVNVYDLDNEVAIQGSTFSYVAHMAVVQNGILNKAQMNLSIIESQIKQELRSKDERDGRKGGPTVDQINAMVRTNSQYLEALVRVRQVEDALEHIRADERASAQKARMLEIIKDFAGKEKRMKPYSKKELKGGEK